MVQPTGYQKHKSGERSPRCDLSQKSPASDAHSSASTATPSESFSTPWFKWSLQAPDASRNPNPQDPLQSPPRWTPSRGRAPREEGCRDGVFRVPWLAQQNWLMPTFTPPQWREGPFWGFGGVSTCFVMCVEGHLQPLAAFGKPSR